MLPRFCFMQSIWVERSWSIAHLIGARSSILEDEKWCSSCSSLAAKVCSNWLWRHQKNETASLMFLTRMFRMLQFHQTRSCTLLYCTICIEPRCQLNTLVSSLTKQSLNQFFIFIFLNDRVHILFFSIVSTALISFFIITTCTILFG